MLDAHAEFLLPRLTETAPYADDVDEVEVGGEALVQCLEVPVTPDTVKIEALMPSIANKVPLPVATAAD